MGAPPSSAEIQPNQTTTLRLSATRLDATVRVDPTPTSARVDVDGVTVGNGVWEGKLRSGKHQVEVTAEGFLAWRREVSVRSGQREVLRVALERDLSNPMWRESFFEPHLYLEALGGPALARSFAGGADAACSDAGCSDRSRPFGFLVGARGGYQLTSGLGLELFLGYLSLSESVTRQKSASGDFPSTATAFEDTTKLRAQRRLCLPAISSSSGLHCCFGCGWGQRGPRRTSPDPAPSADGPPRWRPAGRP